MSSALQKVQIERNTERAGRFLLLCKRCRLSVAAAAAGR